MWLINFDLGICVFTLADIVIVLLYIVLTVLTVKLLLRHRTTIVNGQLNGLIWYLMCTCMLCMFRTGAFIIVPYLNESESATMSYNNDTGQTVTTYANTCSFKEYVIIAWDIGGAYQSQKQSSSVTVIQLQLIQLILSSSASGLFFTSYSYFAHSLAKVLDMLTSDAHHIYHNSPSGGQFFLVLAGQNVCVWISIVCLWGALIFEAGLVNIVDNVVR